jgi:hypothetical protein
VTATWTKPSGESGHATPTSCRTTASGSFWFFDPENVEVFVKVLDACSFSGKWWVFAFGGTNVGVVVTVTDTVTGQVKGYTNPVGTVFVTIADTAAFPCGQ